MSRLFLSQCIKYTRLQKKNRGSILILTLAVLVVLVLLGINLGVGVRQKLMLLERLDTKDKLHFIAEAGIKRAILELKTNPEGNWINNPLIFREILVNEGIFTVGYSRLKQEEDVIIDSEIICGLIDEESKINLNTATEEVLARLLQNVAHLDEESTMKLAYSIIDWRDKDSNFQHPLYGAEDGYYNDLTNPYEAKDSNYEILEELLLAKGMDKDIFEKVRDYLTVYGEGKVNINTAEEQVLLALGLTNKLIGKILSFRYGEDLKEATGDDNIFISTPNIVPELKTVVDLNASEIAQLESLILKGELTTKSENFMVKSTAKLNNRDTTYQIIAVVDRKGEIKYWNEK